MKSEQVLLEQEDYRLIASHSGKELRFQVVKSGIQTTKGYEPLRYDLLLSSPAKVASSILSKLGCNKVIYARQCDVKKITKHSAENFLNEFHLMNATSCAFQFGLFFKDELMSVATFSKGRKMNRLPENQRSFELIRFCTRTGFTVAGGLSKLLMHFVREKKAGDIMTYVDSSTSEGKSFFTAGFKLHSRTPPQEFLISRKNGGITAYREGQNFDPDMYYVFKNSGNLKLVFKPAYT